MAIGKVINPSQLPKIGPIKSGELNSVLGPKKEHPGESFKNMITNGVEKVDASVKQYEALSDKFAHCSGICC